MKQAELIAAQPGDLPDEGYLKLENQLCFPLYASSRMITRLYQPLLEKLGLTYPQSIIMLVLWEHDSLSIREIGDQVQLNTNTLTPLLKRMSEQGLLRRERSAEDERRVLITLTQKGMDMKADAQSVPVELMQTMNFPLEKAIQLKTLLDELLTDLRSQES